MTPMAVWEDWALSRQSGSNVEGNGGHRAGLLNLEPLAAPS